MATVGSSGGPAAALSSIRSDRRLKKRRRLQTTLPWSSVRVATWAARTARSVPSVVNLPPGVVVYVGPNRDPRPSVMPRTSELNGLRLLDQRRECRQLPRQGGGRVRRIDFGQERQGHGDDAAASRARNDPNVGATLTPGSDLT